MKKLLYKLGLLFEYIAAILTSKQMYSIAIDVGEDDEWVIGVQTKTFNEGLKPCIKIVYIFYNEIDEIIVKYGKDKKVILSARSVKAIAKHQNDNTSSS